MTPDLKAYHFIRSRLTEEEALPREDARGYLQLLLDHVSAPAMTHLHTREERLAYAAETLDWSEDKAAVIYAAHRRLFDHEDAWSASDEGLVRSALRIVLNDVGEEKEREIEEATRQGLAYLDHRPTAVPASRFVEGLIVEADAAAKEIKVKNVHTSEVMVFEDEDIHRSVERILPLLDGGISLPVRANFLNNQVISSDRYTAEAIVLDPDFLIDATSIANCFTHAEVFPSRYVVSLLTPSQTSQYIIIGQIINGVLDRMLTDKEVSLNRAMKSAFQTYALSLTSMSNEEVRFIMEQVKLMIANLYHEITTLRREMPNADCYVEPTFISNAYGIQGRLDALFLSQDADDEREVKIVELKTGKVYMPNEAGLNREHHIQSTVYEMLIKDAYDERQKVTASILYAKERHDRLRAAPPSQMQRRMILGVRNHIVARYHAIMSPDREEESMGWIGLGAFDRSTGFVKKDADQLKTLVHKLSPPESALFNKLVASMMRDQYRSKVGSGHDHGRAGFAALWRASGEDKHQHYRLLEGLVYVKTTADGTHAFEITEDAVANFNQGDIIVLYPASRLQPLRGQLLKGVITFINQYEVHVQLRNELVKVDHLARHGPWCAEPDHIDASLRKTMGGVVHFFQMPAKRRHLFMGAARPERDPPVEIDGYENDLTAHQQSVVRMMLAAKDYYLLWGPPGTGKTSRILRTYVSFVYQQTMDKLLLSAYTNRAVDEICDKLVKSQVPFIRIGSSHATSERFRPYLLKQRLSDIEDRKGVKSLLEDTRVIVGTVASLLGREDLFHLMKFDRLVIDEASQLLEPMAMGLIARVPRVVLVGDHHQLPAISQVEDEYAQIRHEKLQKFGYRDVRVSMFERLYLHASAQGWEDVLGQLYEQGRMHEDICQVAASLFYEKRLQVIDHPTVTSRLTGPKPTAFVKSPTWQGRDLDKRLLAIDVPSARREELNISKQNDQEAKCVIDLLVAMYPLLGEDMDIGVICPFRAQIVLVRHGLDAIPTMQDWRDRITIDTVERYQGSERSVIIFNTCASNAQTFDLITSVNATGVDRKLNVALTRAQYHFILVGDLDLARRSANYAFLIDSSVCITNCTNGKIK